MIKSKFAKNEKGFSLIEMLVSMFVMVSIVTTVTVVFAKSFDARRKARQTQANLESARTAIEMISKNMRMSSHTQPAGSVQQVTMHNNSQDKCIRYRFAGGNLYQSIVNASDPNDDCLGAAYGGSEQPIISGGITGGGFYIVETSTAAGNKEVGRGTISIRMDNQTLQTSVSFRDYREVIQ